MRTHGTLTRWNEDRGFGFITTAEGSKELFVHVSAFPRDGVRPRVGEVVSFETEAGPDGKARAVRVMRPGASQRARVRADRRPVDRSPSRNRLAAVLGLLLIGAIAYAGYSRFGDLPAMADTVEAAPRRPAARADSAPRYACDGRTHCSQMRSCDEARYFLRHCPNVEMDGNNDGEPCEQQWCH